MGEQMYSFERMEVWQLSRVFVSSIYRLISLFPNEEKFALCDQIRRATISVPSNIAEGCGRTSLKEQKHFAIRFLSAVCPDLTLPFTRVASAFSVTWAGTAIWKIK